MSHDQAPSDAGFSIEIAPANLAATLLIPAGASPSTAAIIAKLRAMEIRAFDDGALIEAVEKRKNGALSYVVARGTAAVDERSGKVEFRLPVADLTTGTIAKVEIGQIVATLGPTAPGVDGKDVFGKPVPCKKAVLAIGIGRNLVLEKNQIVAKSRGNLRVHAGEVSVEPLLELNGQGDTARGKVNFDGDVSIKGCLEDNRSIQATGCLTVGGAIEAAYVNIDGSVFVRGGMICREKGRAMIHGDLRCRFISGGWVAAGGDVVVQGEIVRSQITSTGKLIATHGPIHGSEVSANGGITCNVLGNASGVATIVSAGSDQTQQLFNATAMAEVEANRKRVRDVRRQIEPLMVQMKMLTPKQREKATELLCEASELEQRTEETVARLHECKERISENSCAEINVMEMIYPGVTIRFPGVEATVRTVIKGPLKIMPQTVGQSKCVVASIAGADGVMALDSRPTAIVHAKAA